MSNADGGLDAAVSLGRSGHTIEAVQSYGTATGRSLADARTALLTSAVNPNDPGAGIAEGIAAGLAVVHGSR